MSVTDMHKRKGAQSMHYKQRDPDISAEQSINSFSHDDDDDAGTANL